MAFTATFNSNLPAIPSWRPANLDPLSRRFERGYPQQTLRWALATYGEDLALATGFGPSGIAVMHMVARMRPAPQFFYLQTDLLFPETLALRDELTGRLGVRFTEIHCGLSLEGQTKQFGPELWKRDPDLCCRLRKVQPLRRFLASKRAWVTAIRRDQSVTRAQVQVVAWDEANHLVKISPLAAWTNEQVWEYLYKNNLPYNPLHDQGYPSIGCIPCTRPVAPGEHERAGRWAGTGKLECGIHIQDGRVVPSSGSRFVHS